jgi:hypothetical protein
MMADERQRATEAIEHIDKRLLSVLSGPTEGTFDADDLIIMRGRLLRQRDKG